MTAPDDPTPVFATAMIGGASVTWPAPAQNVDVYQIVASSGDFVTVDGSTFAASFTSLDPAVVYTFTVIASNSDGNSPGLNTSNAISPLVLVSPDGVYGPIDLPTPTPDPHVVVPQPVTTTDPAAQTTAGNVVLMYLQDDATGDVLVITPKGDSGLGLVDFDPGFATVRESVFNLPSRDGTYDASAYLGNSAVSLTLLATPGKDVNGVRQSAGYWLDVITSWMHPARRPRLVWQIRGQVLKQASLRASQLSGPFTSSGAGRSSINVQAQWKNPAGVVYTRNPVPNMSVTPNDGRSMVTVIPSSTGSGISFNLTFPIQFGASGDGSALVSYAGQVPTFCEIYMYGGAVSPQFILEQSTDGETWNVLPAQTLTLSGLTVNNGDILRIVTGPSPSALVYTAAGAINNVRKYLSAPPQWWKVTPGIYNRVRFNAGSSNAGTVGYVLYYDTFLR